MQGVPGVSSPLEYGAKAFASQVSQVVPEQKRMRLMQQLSNHLKMEQQHKYPYS